MTPPLFYPSFTMQKQGESEEKCGAVVLGGKTLKALKLNEWGIRKTRGIVGLEEACAMWKRDKKFPKHVTFLMDYRKEDTPETTSFVLQLSRRIMERFRGEVAVLCRNMRVPLEGADTLYRNDRSDGAVIHKYSGTVTIEQPGGSFIVRFDDDYSGRNIGIETDLIIVTEETAPSM